MSDSVNKKSPALLLLPNLLGEQRYHDLFLPQSVDRAVATLDGLIAESPTAGRRYLGRFQTKKPPHEIPIAVYSEHTPDHELDFLLELIKNGERWGLVSDCGLPCIADPGYKLVRRARQVGLPIQAFVGPSAIFLSLMLSGLPGQNFSFHGYLHRDLSVRKREIAAFEKRSFHEQSTHICIETPYRNKQTLELFLETLKDKTVLCVAWELTLPSQGLVTQNIAQWKKVPLPNLDKRNAMFLSNATAL